jgi:hypothetical protein
MSISACGFKGVGKDTFYKKMISGLIVEDYNSEYKPKGYQWVVYAPEVMTMPIFNKESVRIGTGDPMKDKCHDYLGLPAGNYEKVKDSLVCMDPLTREMKVLRQHYVFYADSKRKLDPYHWPRAASAPIIKNLSEEDIKKVCFYNSDWRYFPEYEYYCKHFNIPLTIRFFRKDVPVPGRECLSEWSLEKVTTHLLLVPSTEDFDVAITIFPQYSTYKPRWIVHD